MTDTYYHGGPCGLNRILPSSVTGTKSLADYGGEGITRRDKVYVVTSYTAARLEDSAVACINAGTPYWWPHTIDEGRDEHGDPDISYWVVRYADPWREGDDSPVLGSVQVADYDAMVEECIRRNEELARAASAPDATTTDEKGQAA